ncbi:EAL domain-containing response regulator [Photobacterium sp. 1_MG-2023]|uniref:EAL domain-containing response regulator n=1 Tax=Photobacterium sp. 1_MG-2023 TaxID=3062646 RepID=UPI0026E3419B|nr:EAL domain-containing response regulator [Photobacterium sp. 1_MG-2023]MDO6708753.1 EAL domain-containing response regulator [Photobacterium sp. 1_MG-2023]
MDDNIIDLYTIKIILNKLGVKNISLVKEGEDGLELCNQINFDLVVCDLDMPTMDGLTFLRLLDMKNYSGGVCIVSGKSENIIDIALRMCENSGFKFIKKISKPVEIHGLKEAIDFRWGTYPNKNPVSKVVDDILKNIDASDVIRGLKSREFVAYYQPKFSLTTGNIIGCEALIRWQHPSFGLLLPDDFLPLITNSEHVDMVFFYMLDLILQHMKNEKMPENVAINASHISFDRIGFSERVIALCKKYNISLSRVTIELVESEKCKITPSMLENFARLRIHGISLSVDDFGMGYSSLHKLAFLPFSEVKIDRSFISNCLQDERCKSIVITTLNLSLSLGARVVAEGIEDKATLDFIKSLGIQVAQGYYLSRPIPIEKLLLLMDS